MQSPEDKRIQDLDGASLPALLAMLASDDPRDRADAACAVGDRLRTGEVQGLEPTMQERLAELLADPVPAVCFEAAVALAEARDGRATPVLLLAMGSRHVRLDAIRALGASGDRRALGPLTKFMKRWLIPWADRLQAAAALCALGDETGAEYLREKLSSRRRMERAAAIHFVGESRHPQARGLLLAILETPGEPLADVAVRALGMLRDPACRPALEQALAGASAELAQDIREALARLAQERPADRH
jgi:HEAT repeat protein